MKKKEICGAKTRKGTPCKRPPAKGRNRCKLHGGAQPRGPKNTNYKHGLYSKYAGDSLREVLDDLDGISEEELVQPDNEIKLMQALIIKAKAFENDTIDLKGLNTISKIIDRLISAKQRSQAIMIEQERLIPASDVKLFLDWVEELLLDQIGKHKAFEVINELKQFKISDHANNGVNK